MLPEPSPRLYYDTMYELVILTGPKAGTVVPVVSDLVAGRSPDCSLEVPDPNASRAHCRFHFDGSTLTVADNGSSNGTWINDQRQPGATLKPGDVVRLGETRLKVQARRAQITDDPNASSIFTFKDHEQDLSQSLVLSADPAQGSNKTAEARLTAIIKALSALSDMRHLDKVLHAIIDSLFEVFPQAERCFIMLGDEVEKLEPKAIRTRKVGEGVPTVSRSICRKALNGRNAVLFNEGAGDQDIGMSIVSLKIRSAMTVPLILEDRVLGLAQLDTSDNKRSFTKDDLEVAVALGRLAAVGINNASMVTNLEKTKTARDNLARFVPGPAADLVISGKMDMGLGGKTYTGTMMFSDVVGFTRLSESLPPEEVVQMMNDYFEHVVPCIRAEEGSIDKFIGDAIFAYWGFPIDKGDAVQKACSAALAMQRVLHGFNSQRAAKGRFPLGHGIGLHTGPVVWGNIGTAELTNATALGDAVNTASRIEHSALPGQVLVSLATWQALAGKAYGVRMPPMSAKNKAEPLTVFSLRGLAATGDEMSLHLPARSGNHPVVLIRRLADRSLLALTPAGCELAASDLVVAVPELDGIILGRPTPITTLPPQSSDGLFQRCHFTLPDPSLQGLLGSEPPACPFGWDRFTR
jgi:adenylate cyclase